MTHRSLKLLGLALLVQSQAQANFLRLDIPLDSVQATGDISFVDGYPLLELLHLQGKDKDKLEAHYAHCLNFTDAMYCDASSGSCEHGTCGKNNELCKPIMASSRERHTPKQGPKCLAYAYSKL